MALPWPGESAWRAPQPKAARRSSRSTPSPEAAPRRGRRSRLRATGGGGSPPSPRGATSVPSPGLDREARLATVDAGWRGGRRGSGEAVRSDRRWACPFGPRCPRLERRRWPPAHAALEGAVAQPHGAGRPPARSGGTRTAWCRRPPAPGGKLSRGPAVGRSSRAGRRPSAPGRARPRRACASRISARRRRAPGRWGSRPGRARSGRSTRSAEIDDGREVVDGEVAERVGVGRGRGRESAAMRRERSPPRRERPHLRSDLACVDMRGCQRRRPAAHRCASRAVERRGDRAARPSAAIARCRAAVPGRPEPRGRYPGVEVEQRIARAQPQGAAREREPRARAAPPASAPSRAHPPSARSARHARRGARASRPRR